VDTTTVIAFPRARAIGDVSAGPSLVDDAGAAALTEIDAAIALVVGRAARRVRLTAVPFVESVAAIGLAHARSAGLAFQLERPERSGVVTVTIGPLEARRESPSRG
jgi:hypothetical protein